MIEANDFDLLYQDEDSVKHQHNPNFIMQYAMRGNLRFLARVQQKIDEDKRNDRNYSSDDEDQK